MVSVKVTVSDAAVMIKLGVGPKTKSLLQITASFWWEDQCKTEFSDRSWLALFTSESLF